MEDRNQSREHIDYHSFLSTPQTKEDGPFNQSIESDLPHKRQRTDNPLGRDFEPYYHRRETTPKNQTQIVSQHQGRNSLRYSQGRDSAPHHQSPKGSHRQGSGIYPQSRDIAPHHQSPKGCHRHGSGKYPQSRYIALSHQSSIGSHSQGSGKYPQSRDIGPQHQSPIGSHGHGSGQYPQKRDIAPHHQSPIGSHKKCSESQASSQPQWGDYNSSAIINTEHSNDRSGGWLEEDIINPHEDKYTPNYANDQNRMLDTDFADHCIQKYGGDQSMDLARRQCLDDYGPPKSNYMKEESNFRRDPSFQERYNSHTQNWVDQGAYLFSKKQHPTGRPIDKKNRAHPYGFSYANDRSNDGPDNLLPFQMDTCIGHANANTCFVDKQFSSTKNLQEPFHSNRDDSKDEEEDEDDDYGSDSEEAEAEEKAYQKLLPKVKELVDKVCGYAKPSLIDKAELSCLVCPTMQYFKGWKALLSHACHFKKKKTVQHRGYHRALEKVLQIKEEEGQGQEQDAPITARASFIDPTISESHVIVWPPIVIIESAGPKSQNSLSKTNTKESRITQVEKTTEVVTIENLISQEFQDLHPKEIIFCGESRFIILFEASSVGYMEAKVMNDRLRERKQGREDWMHFKDWEHSRSSRDHNGTTIMLFGYLAEPVDLKIIDPNKTIVKNWSEESYQEKVQGANKRMKKEHEDKQAKLKAMKLEVVTLFEDEQKFKIHKQVLWRQIQIRQKEIEEQQERTQEMQERFAEEERKLLDKFKEEMDIFDKNISAYERELKEQLERNEKLLEEERISRMRQIEKRRLELKELKEDYQKLAEQKALDRESEVMARRKNFMAEVRKAEADFNEKIRTMESSLQDKQQEEMMKLVEESNREREAFYKEWLKEQEILKKEAEEARKHKEQLQKENAEQEMTPECMVCWDDLTPENRALLDPCGHARLCIGCAKEVFKIKKQCPLCRQKISKKPIVCPKSLLGALQG